MANYNLTQTGAEVQELLNKVSLFGKFTCSDAADSQVKNIHIDDFTLIDGVAIAVTFVNGNSVASIQLNVNYTGNVPVYYRDSPLGNRLVTANATVILMYNATGNRWDVLSELCGTIGEAASRDVATEITDESSDEDIPTVGAVKGTMKGLLEKVQNVVYDISAAHPDGQGNPTPYADLTAALGTGGVNIPEDIRKGGMSIKFIQGTVQSSDNNYVQYYLIKDTWGINPSEWEKINIEQELGILLEDSTVDSDYHNFDYFFKVGYTYTIVNTSSTASTQLLSARGRDGSGTSLETICNDLKVGSKYVYTPTVDSIVKIGIKIIGGGSFKVYCNQSLLGNQINYADNNNSEHKQLEDYSILPSTICIGKNAIDDWIIPSQDSSYIASFTRKKSGIIGIVTKSAATQGFFRLYNDSSQMPTGFTVGKKYYIYFNASVTLTAQIYGLNSGGGVVGSMSLSNGQYGIFTYTSNMVGFVFRVVIPSYTKIDEDIFCYLSETPFSWNLEDNIEANAGDIETNSKNIELMNVERKVYTPVADNIISNIPLPSEQSSYIKSYLFDSKTKIYTVNCSQLYADTYFYFYKEDATLPSCIDRNKIYYVRYVGVTSSLQILGVTTTGGYTALCTLNSGESGQFRIMTDNIVGLYIRVVFPQGQARTENICLFISETPITIDQLNDSLAPIPPYWDNEMNTCIGKINLLDAGIGFNGKSFVFITDPHVPSNYRNSPRLIEHILENSSINDVVCGGDLIEENDDKQIALMGVAEWRSLLRKTNPYYVIGNHDNNPDANQGQSRITDAELYGLLIRQVSDRMICPQSQLYGYVDDDSSKTRYIIVNTHSSSIDGNKDLAQLEWFSEKLTEKGAGWHIIVFMHMALKKTEGVIELDANGLTIANLIESSNMTAEMVAVICGHCHFDGNFTTAGGTLFISTTADTFGGRIAITDPDNPRQQFTDTEHSFDVYHINYNTKTINITRVGGGNDRMFSY